MAKCLDRRWLGLILGVATLLWASFAQAASVDLTVTKTAPSTVQTLTPFEYKITVKNVGAETATLATLTDTLPAYLYGITTPTVVASGTGTVCPTSFVLPDTSGTNTTGTASNNKLTATIPSLPTEGECIITFKVSAVRVGSYGNSVTVAARQGDTDAAMGSNTASVTTNVTSIPADLSLTKVRTTPLPASGLFNFGDAIAYEVVLKNNSTTVDIPPQVAITFNDVQLTTLSNARMGGAQSTLTAYSCTATGNAACPPEGTGADNLKWNTAPAGAYGYYAFAPGMIRGLPAGASITYRYTVVTNSDGATCGGAIGLTDLLRDALVYGAGALGTFPFTDANGIIESPSSVSTPMNPPRTCKLAPAWFSTSKVLIGDTSSIDTEGEVKTYRFTVTRNTATGANAATANTLPLTLVMSEQMLYNGWSAFGPAGSGVKHTARVVKCTPSTSGASCPAQWATMPYPLVDAQYTTINGMTPVNITTAYPFRAADGTGAYTVTINAPGDSITFEIEFGYTGLNSLTCVRTPSALTNNFSATHLGVPPGFDDWEDSRSSINPPDVPLDPNKPLCVDVAVNKTISPTNVAAGQPITFTLDVTNNSFAAVGNRRTATNVPLTDVLGSQFIPSAASCSVLSGTATAPVVTLAGNISGANNTFAATIPSMDDGATVRCQITGAAVQAGSFTNTATVNGTTGTTRGTLHDVNAANDSSSQTYGIGNPASITLTKKLSGATAGYVGGTTFPATVACTVTPTAGASTTVSQTVNLVPDAPQTVNVPAQTAQQTVNCAISEGALPAPATHFVWGTPTVSPANVNGLGPTANGAVTIINPLIDTRVNLAITKFADPANTYTPDQPLKYDIRVTNNGPADAVGVQVSDLVPSTVTVTSWTCSAVGAGADCDSTTSGTAAGGTTNSISLGNVTLPAGTSIAITVTGKASISATGPITNTATAAPPRGVACTTAPCTKTADVTNTSAGSPQLSISKTANPGTFAVGATGSYAITVSNVGTGATTDTITVNDPLPLGITATLPVTAAGWDCTGSTTTTVNCTRSNALNPGASAPVINVTVAIGVNAVSPSVNTARVSGGGDSTCPASGATLTRCQGIATTAIDAPSITVKKTLQDPLVVNVANHYIITATNNGQAATLAGTLTDPIPAGLTIGALPAGCTASGQNLTCDIPAGMATGSSVSYTIPVTPDNTVNGQAVSNTATANGAGDPTCPSGDHCKGTATGTVTAPQLKLEKSVSPTTLVVGQAGSYTLKVTNQGTAATTAIATVSDAIPAGLAIGSPLPAGCTATGQSLNCTIASGLATGASTSFVIPVTANASLLGQSVTNNASVTGGGDPGCPTGTATASLIDRCKASVPAPISAPQMTIVKTASANWAVGVPASYTLEVTNTGSADSFGTITVTDVIPGSLTLGALPAGCTAVGHQVSCTSSAVLAKGARISFVIPVTSTSASAPSVSNTATVQGGGDPVCPSAAATNCSSTVVTPVAAPKLQIAETANGPWTIGMSGAAYAITVTNVGPATTTGVVTVNATLPTGLAPGWSGTTTLDGWSCTANGHDIACTATPNLAQNGTSTFTLPVTVLATAVPSVTTPAAVGGGGDPFNGGTTPAAGTACTTLDASPAPNHCATVTLPIPTSGAVTTVKMLDASTKTPLVAGQLVTYALTATNSGGTGVSNYTLNEVVPAGATFTSVTGGTSSCAAGAAAGTLCTVTIASVPAAGSASVQISFTLLRNLPADLKQIVNVISEPAACAGALCDAPPPPAGCTGSTCTPVNVCTAGDPHCVSTPLTPPAGPVAIPTVSQWMLLVMAIMLTLLGGGRSRADADVAGWRCGLPLRFSTQFAPQDGSFSGCAWAAQQRPDQPTASTRGAALKAGFSEGSSSASPARIGAAGVASRARR